MPQSCRTCSHLAVPLDIAGRRRPTKNSVYRCNAPVPALPPMPDSVIVTVAPARWMEPRDGDACPTYKPLAASV